MGRRRKNPLAGADASWMQDAKCREVGPSVMVPPPLVPGSAGQLLHQRRVAAAKAVCVGCPVIDPCLEWAIRYREVGVWGGTTDSERRRIIKARKSV